MDTILAAHCLLRQTCRHREQAASQQKLPAAVFAKQGSERRTQRSFMHRAAEAGSSAVGTTPVASVRPISSATIADFSGRRWFCFFHGSVTFPALSAR